jgi:hypothetical protein
MTARPPVGQELRRLCRRQLPNTQPAVLQPAAEMRHQTQLILRGERAVAEPLQFSAKPVGEQRQRPRDRHQPRPTHNQLPSSDHTVRRPNHSTTHRGGPIATAPVSSHASRPPLSAGWRKWPIGPARSRETAANSRRPEWAVSIAAVACPSGSRHGERGMRERRGRYRSRPCRGIARGLASRWALLRFVHRRKTSPAAAPQWR